MSALDAHDMTAANESMGDSHQWAVQFGHCFPIANGMPELSLESLRCEHIATAPVLFWTQFAKVRA
jgi:hypothetical protein